MTYEKRVRHAVEVLYKKHMPHRVTLSQVIKSIAIQSIHSALNVCEQNHTKAGERLGMARATLTQRVDVLRYSDVMGVDPKVQPHINRLAYLDQIHGKLTDYLNAVQKELIEIALADTSGRVSFAARNLGVLNSSLEYKIKALDIVRELSNTEDAAATKLKIRIISALYSQKGYRLGVSRLTGYSLSYVNLLMQQYRVCSENFR